METAVGSAVPCYQNERLVSLAAYCVCATLLVMRLSDDCVLSAQLLLVVFDLAYCTSSEFAVISDCTAAL